MNIFNVMLLSSRRSKTQGNPVPVCHFSFYNSNSIDRQANGSAEGMIYGLALTKQAWINEQKPQLTKEEVHYVKCCSTNLNQKNIV